jgi:hypothetical protein
VRLRRRTLALVAGLALARIPGAAAYDGSDHQALTFLAAKQFNRCVEGTAIAPLTPLQVRYMARANAGLVDRSVFARMFNWRYYDRDRQAEQSMLWLIDTRFHDHFNELSERLDSAADQVEAYQDLGRILSYVQLVSSPPHVVPVYTARFWRFSFGDRFDSFPLDEDALREALEDDCSFLDHTPTEFSDILGDVADRTMTSVEAPINGMPTSWTAFWNPNDDPGSFGDYGPAGNSFGRRTEFRCGGERRCVLLKDDPLYTEFALDRHLDALQGTLAAMLLMQTRVQETVARAQ